MRHIRLAMMVVLLLGTLGAGKPDLRGRVLTQDGKPLAGATAYVYTAAVRTGFSPFCPSCYADCGRSAVTDKDGAFLITGLDPELIFRILLVAEGYKPILVSDVDPAIKPVEAKLDPMPTTIDPTRTVRGRVLGPDGDPVVGAIVSPEGCKTAEKRWWGSMPGVDPMSITNARGEFLITAEQPAIAFDLQVEARSLATRNFPLVAVGSDSHELRLTDGVTLTGRLIKDGKYVPNVAVGIVQSNRGMENFTAPEIVATDSEGRFTFVNVAGNQDWFVYGIMSGATTLGAPQVKKVRAGADKTVADAGDLSFDKSHTLSGRVVLSDGKLIPPQTRILLTRTDAWDSQTEILDPGGRFTFRNVPVETIGLSVHIKGYHTSKENFSRDPLNITPLVGKVDQDIDGLTILLDAGELTEADYRHGPEASVKWEEIHTTQIRGVAPTRGN